MSQDTSPLYEFGPFRLDTGKNLLLRGGESIPLPPKAFETLLLLVQHSGQVLSKQRLMNSLWPDSFVEESNLTQNIFVLRKALGDTPQDRRYILTIPGKGYRFTAPVALVSVSGYLATPTPPAALQPQPDDSSATPSISPAPLIYGTSGWRASINERFLLAGVAVLIAIAGAFAFRMSHQSAAASTGKIMMAVMPFENLTGDSRQEYISDGLTEEMITQLGNLDPRHLGVIARTSVMHYKNGQTPLDQIGQNLAVQYVLEGSVRRDSDKVRITAQFIQVKDQTRVWSRQYDRELKELLSVQGEIAGEIADEIQLALGDHKPIAPAAAPPRSSQQYEAYDLYLKGQYFFNKRSVPDFRQAIEYFEQATRKDPGSARAYATLADSYMLLSAYSLAPQSELVPKARSAALRSLQLDDNLPEGHTALALILENYDWDWQTAEKEFLRAIELNPNYATAHHWYAEHLMWRGRFDEALRESERARQLDPLSLIIATDNGAILYYSRQYDAAIKQLQAVLDMDPNFPRAHIIESAYAGKGMFREALSDLEKQRSAVAAQWYWSSRANICGRSAQIPQARQALQELKKLTQHQQIDPAVFISAYLGIGDREQTLFWLERAYAQHSNAITAIKVSPDYDPLRSDPRFQDLVRRAGLSN